MRVKLENKGNEAYRDRYIGLGGDDVLVKPKQTIVDHSDTKKGTRLFRGVSGLTILSNLMVSVEVLAFIVPSAVSLLALATIIGGFVSFITAALTTILGHRVEDKLQEKKTGYVKKVADLEREFAIRGLPIAPSTYGQKPKDQIQDGEPIHTLNGNGKKAAKNLHRFSHAAVMLDIAAVVAGIITLAIAPYVGILIMGAAAGMLSLTASSATLKYGLKTEKKLKEEIRDYKQRSDELETQLKRHVPSFVLEEEELAITPEPTRVTEPSKVAAIVETKDQPSPALLINVHADPHSPEGAKAVAI